MFLELDEKVEIDDISVDVVQNVEDDEIDDNDELDFQDYIHWISKQNVFVI